jgi:glucose 1-dehydrogenase
MDSRTGRVEGKRVLVTGADRGIGAGIARILLSEGAKVCLNTLGDPSSARAALDRNGIDSSRVFAFRADVRDEAQVSELIAAACDAFGGIDVLVNNAGIESVHSAFDLAAEEWDRILDTNLRGAFLAAREAGGRMRSLPQGGVIINISSIHASVPRLGTVHYCVSKAGLDMLTRCLALEWAEYRIRVVGIAPGAIETNINREIIERIGRENFDRWIPLGRFGSVADIANAVIFLCSDQASYITGVTLPIDGAYALNTIQYDPRAL